jgi:hypothetical protein
VAIEHHIDCLGHKLLHVAFYLPFAIATRQEVTITVIVVVVDTSETSSTAGGVGKAFSMRVTTWSKSACFILGAPPSICRSRAQDTVQTWLQTAQLAVPGFLGFGFADSL